MTVATERRGEHESQDGTHMMITPIQRVVATFESPNLPDETIDGRFRRLEHELATVLAELPIVDAWHMARRISNPASDDPIGWLFSRMLPERQNRLVTFLANAPRREAARRRVS